jgi:hypothetical protein
VPVLPLGQHPLVFLVGEVAGGLQHPARLGRVLKESGVVTAGPVVLFDPGPSRLQRGQTPVIVVGVEVAEKDHFMDRSKGTFFSPLL